MCGSVWTKWYAHVKEPLASDVCVCLVGWAAGGMTKGVEGDDEDLLLAHMMLLRQYGELFTLTYGSLVMQLIKDHEDMSEVNKQLDKMCERARMSASLLAALVAHFVIALLRPCHQGLQYWRPPH